jgi:sugar lactone lactonase YvrE
MLDLRIGERGDLLMPQGLGFSPDGKTIAVIHGLRGRIKFFQVGSWTLSGSLLTYPEERIVTLGDLAFNPDGAMIAVGSTGRRLRVDVSEWLVWFG